MALYKITEHLFNTCLKAQSIWSSISNAIGKQILFHDAFTSGNQLYLTNTDLDMFDQQVIVSAIWLLWKARCNLIFRNEAPDFHIISIKAINHVREYLLSPSTQIGKQLILNHFTIFDSPFLFVSTVGNCETVVYGVGFYIILQTTNLNLYVLVDATIKLNRILKQRLWRSLRR